MLETIKTKDYVPDSAWSLNKMDCKPFTPTYILNIVLSHLTPLFDLNFLSEILINFARFQVFELQVNSFPIWWLDKKVDCLTFELMVVVNDRIFCWSED